MPGFFSANTGVAKWIVFFHLVRSAVFFLYKGKHFFRQAGIQWNKPVHFLFLRICCLGMPFYNEIISCQYSQFRKEKQDKKRKIGDSHRRRRGG